MTVEPNNVHKILEKNLLVDGFDIIFDSKKSTGCQIFDSKSKKYMLDCFSFFASAPLGSNHPELTTPEYIKKLGELSVNKPTNSDIYTTEMAEFVDIFTKYAVPSYLPHLFFVSGGALGVENALKTAFDWKVRKNFQRGSKKELGTKVIHFEEAFHGRTGYTLSLTNTFNENKYKYFPKFCWPRITNPKITFPLNEKNLEKVITSEKKAIEQIETAIKTNPDDIAALIIEPIQAEGGDNHFRKEFFHELRKICDNNEIMFILDEVQTGIGLTGKMWAHEQYDFKPDMIAFGKKTQVCGCMVSRRVDEIKDNVFTVSSRLNSTWGGNLIDMVRCQKYLEIIHKENLVKNAEKIGKHLLKGLQELQDKYPDIISNVRGLGLMCAFDCNSPEEQGELINKFFKKDLIIVGCGAKTIRFRPPLIITAEEIDKALSIIEETLKNL